MIHDVPASGMMTHGMFGYNLQFFFVLCRDNRYEVLDLGLVHGGSSVIHGDIVGSNAQYARLPSHSDWSEPFYESLKCSVTSRRLTFRRKFSHVRHFRVVSLGRGHR
jgi:hypothetical protein